MTPLTAVGYGDLFTYEYYPPAFTNKSFLRIRRENLANPPGPSMYLTPEADAHVHLGQPDNNAGSEARIFVKGTGSGSTTRKGYIRFNVSAVPTSVNDASLELFLTSNNSPTGTYTVEIYGLKDNAAGQDWAEGGITWNNASANITSGNGIDTAQADLLARFVVPAINPANTVGPDPLTVTNADSVGTDALINFINADRDGKITLILRRSAQTGNNLGFGSRESGGQGPSLTLSLD
jgi:hypothetical protein